MKSTKLIKYGMVAGVVMACGFGAVLAEGPTTAPATVGGPDVIAPARGEPVATVNGQDIDRAKFDDILMEVAGLRVFQEVLDLVLVQQQCLGAMIPVDGPDFQKLVQAELDRTLADLGDQNVPPEQRNQVLRQLLNQKGITDTEFQMGLRRAAMLRQLAIGKVKDPTKEEIEMAFTAEYGEKVQLQVMTVKDIPTAAALRKQIEKGEDPKNVAQASGVPWQQVTISGNNTDPEPISRFKDLGFKELAEKQLSATYSFTPKGATGPVYYMVYLDKKMPKQDVQQASVEKKVAEKVRGIKESNWMNDELITLRTRSTVKINDKILSFQFEQIRKSMEAQRAATQAAATQPTATAPAK